MNPNGCRREHATSTSQHDRRLNSVPETGKATNLSQFQLIYPGYLKDALFAAYNAVL
jgi:hypothetical protein